MSDRASFAELCQHQWRSGRFLSVGLDSDRESVEQLTPHNSSTGARVTAQAEFNRAIVDATAGVAGAYKPNSAFYESNGADGIRDLRDTIAYIKAVSPDTPVILDAKRADIGNSNIAYAEYAFKYLKADAITVHPYLGKEALQPFLDRADKGIFVLCRTSNRGAGEFQDLQVEDGRLFEKVAKNVAQQWNTKGNCGVVVGATYPQELAQVRGLVGDIPILIPGIGAQGGDIESSVRAGLNSRAGGIFLNASRSVIFRSSGPDFATAAGDEAMRLHAEIRKAMQ